MMLYVTGSHELAEADAQAFYAGVAASWPGVAESTAHPRTGKPCLPAQTRFDLFLTMFAPSPKPTLGGLRIQTPPPKHSPQWALSLRRALRELIRADFPVSQRYEGRLDPSGPLTVAPSRSLPPLTEQAMIVPAQGDPSQLATDPRLWLVLAPPLEVGVEDMFLPTFLRAEPFARVARAPGRLAGVELTQWLARETEALVSGKGLIDRGLVLASEDPALATRVVRDDAGVETMRTTEIEAYAGLEETYAWRIVLQPGGVSARLHSHTGSEEIYVVLEGNGLLRVNERLVPIQAGDVFGKPRGYGCATQLINSGTSPLVILDIGTAVRDEVDVCHYPEHGEIFVHQAGHFWTAPTHAIESARAWFPLYQRRYYRIGSGSNDKA